LSNVKSYPGDYDRLLVRPRRACYLLDCGTTHLYELLDKGELASILDGRSRKITVESINRYIEKRLVTGKQIAPVPQRRGQGRPRKTAGPS
jgi:excisionase family DNA binding protein